MSDLKLHDRIDPSVMRSLERFNDDVYPISIRRHNKIVPGDLFIFAIVDDSLHSSRKFVYTYVKDRIQNIDTQSLFSNEHRCLLVTQVSHFDSKCSTITLFSFDYHEKINFYYNDIVAIVDCGHDRDMFK